MPRILYLLVALSFIAGSCTQAGYKESKTAEGRAGEKTEDTSHVSWSKNATIYEVNIRQFSHEGTFSEVGEDLRRLRNLGVKILWLMPIHPIGEKDRKGSLGSYYSVKDYKAVNPEFGTMEDFKDLVYLAHQEDMKVIIDWVANHSAHDNVWVENHKDWYILDAAGNTTPPEGTDWSDVAALDYDNEDMRAAMIDAMKFWVEETGIDGFRCDVAGMVPRDFWEAARDSLEAVKPDIFMLAESEIPELLEKAFDMDYGWEFLHIMNNIALGNMELDAIDEYMAKNESRYQPNDYRMYFTTNHDENTWNGTVFERYGEEGHKAFAALAFTIDGMPLIYSGQESGNRRALAFFEKDTIPWLDYPLQDFYADLFWLNRDNPALWNGSFGGDFKRLKTTADDKIYAFERRKDLSKVISIINLSNDTVRFSVEDMDTESMVSVFGEHDNRTFADSATARPWEFFIFSRM